MEVLGTLFVSFLTIWHCPWDCFFLVKSIFFLLISIFTSFIPSTQSFFYSAFFSMAISNSTLTTTLLMSILICVRCSRLFYLGTFHLYCSRFSALFFLNFKNRVSALLSILDDIQRTKLFSLFRGWRFSVE